MIRKFVLPLLALAGFLLGIWTVHAGNKPVPAAAAVVQPPQPPFESYVAGAGIVEASSRNIPIGTPVSGLVVEVFVEAGDLVVAGQPLFRLDDRDLKAQLGVRQAALASAQAELAKLQQQPRPENIPPAEARVHAAEMTLADLQNQLTMWNAIPDKRAVTQEELDRKRFAVQVAQARLVEAKAELDLLHAGAWQPDIAIAAAAVESARAQVKLTETDLDRLIVRAPVEGRILQRNVEPGQYAAAGAMDSSGMGNAGLMLLGRVSDLHVRVDVDENDAWRMKAGANAIAHLRGNSRFKANLQFVRFEPYIVPKRSLTGASTERVDTRVLQVIYKLDPQDMPVYVGQLMDVFIEAPPIDDAAAATLTSPAYAQPLKNGGAV